MEGIHMSGESLSLIAAAIGASVWALSLSIGSLGPPTVVAWFEDILLAGITRGG